MMGEISDVLKGASYQRIPAHLRRGHADKMNVVPARAMYDYEVSFPALGEGGMGKVFLVQKKNTTPVPLILAKLEERVLHIDADTLDREVAQGFSDLPRNKWKDSIARMRRNLPEFAINDFSREFVEDTLDLPYEFYPSMFVWKVPLVKRLDDKNRGVEDILHEASVTMGLDKPHIVRLEGMGIVPSSVLGEQTDSPFLPYLEMEYLDGGTLSDFIFKHKFLGLRVPSFVAGYILYNVARACDEAYSSRSLIHRDLSPENIGFTSNGIVKVLDYGIAVAADSDDANYLKHGFGGKMSWASPEQIWHPLDIMTSISDRKTIDLEAEKRLREIKISSDIFTIGLIGYYMLTYKNPFDARSIDRDKYPEVIANLNAPSPFAKMKGAYDIRSELCGSIHPIYEDSTREYNNLAKIIQDCMTLDPEERVSGPDHLMYLLMTMVLYEFGSYTFSITEEGFRDYCFMLDDLFHSVTKGIEDSFHSPSDKDPATLIATAHDLAHKNAVWERRYVSDDYRKNLSRIYVDGRSMIKAHPFVFWKEWPYDRYQ